MYDDFLISDCAFILTVYPRSPDPFYTVAYIINWVKTSWTYSTVSNPFILITDCAGFELLSFCSFSIRVIFLKHQN